MRLLDRYVIREVVGPFLIGFLVFTFMLIVPFLVDYAESFISKGVPAEVVLQVMATLIPSALALTIPMSLLLGLLVAFGRLSTDREFVAMQACGVSAFRLLRPVGILSVLCCATTSYVMLVAVPDANQRFREITFGVVAARAEGEVRPRTFFEDFPNLVVYVRDIPLSGSGWTDVFMADNRPGQPSATYLASHGRIVIDRNERSLELILQDGTRHTADAAGAYEVFQFDELLLRLDATSVFPREAPPLGAREMSIAQLRLRATELEAEGLYPHSEYFEIHKKFSIPVACLVFGLIGLTLGVSNRREGKLASFTLGIFVIFAYYVLLWFGQALVRGHVVSPWLAAWMPNILLGGLGGLLFFWRDRTGDRPIRVRRLPGPKMFKVPVINLPMLGVLDRYLVSTYSRIAGLSALALVLIFYISTFLDLSARAFDGEASWGMLAAYFWYITPQYLYYIIPLTVLLAALVTIGLLTKNSELVVMRACGISLYRTALPVVGAALIAGGTLFLLGETVLGPSNRKAEELRHVIRGGSPETFDVFQRHWVVGSGGEIYHFDYFDPRAQQFNGLSVYDFGPSSLTLARRTYAERGVYVGGDDPSSAAWQLQQGWTRELTEAGETTRFLPFSESETSIEPPGYFSTQQPDERFMSRGQLGAYTAQLQASGFDVRSQLVALERKLSFPFVTLVMTLIAVPFAVTAGRRSAMYSVGIGIVMAIVYWVAISVFAALGAGGLIGPVLAAWAPNLLFGAGAGYLLLTVRT